jgi:hypothetical protein
MARFMPLMVLGAAWLMTPNRSDGRQIFPKTYEELYASADLVVIANALATEDAGKGLKNKGNDEYRVAVLTTLKVIHIVKGKHKDPKLVVFHYRFTDRGRHVENGPSYVRFDTREKNDLSGSPYTAYLLYLKRRDDGLYECVTGQTDPVFSVKVIKPAED